TAEHDADPGADSEDGRDQPDSTGDLVRWELVADDPERQREDAAADALDHPRHDQHDQAVRDGREQCAGAEHDQRPDEDVLLAEHVSEVWRSCWIVGSAGTTAELSIA